jgi:hypothetical protein
VEQLAPYADEMGWDGMGWDGIVLLEGFSRICFSPLRNVKKPLTDFDASGLLIAKTIPSVHRIGIDFETYIYEIIY